MVCEEFKNSMMDYIYDEISQQEREALEAHLAGCASCREELQALQQIQQQLQQWPDVDADLKLVFVEDPKSAFGWFRERFAWLWGPRLKYATGFAVVCAAFFLFFAVLNTQISYKEGDFKVSMSLWSKAPDLPEDAVVLTRDQWLQMQQAQLLQMEEFILQSEARQRLLVGQAIQQLAIKIDEQRKNDLQLVEQGLQRMNYQTAYRFAETDRALSEMLQYALREQGVTP
ncbi:zf-HC2 domain-containing protein [candidate division KSB1 bacterium]|nr:zf-HC2 domain-containing protein [candidate division KSB1 bacterium]